MKLLWIPKGIFILALPIILLLGTLISFATTTNTTPPPLAGQIIIIDAGHGGIDPGANRPGILEKDINLAVSLKLKEVLNQYGAKVILSRETDIDLSAECDNEKIIGRYRRDLAARIEMVEESDADLFISIHANAVSNSKRHGAESFYYSNSEEGQLLANSIQTELKKVTDRAPAPHAANYFVLRKNHIPATLVELGYITNGSESTLLQSPEYQQQLAEAIALGISTYYQEYLTSHKK